MRVISLTSSHCLIQRVGLARLVPSRSHLIARNTCPTGVFRAKIDNALVRTVYTAKPGGKPTADITGSPGVVEAGKPPASQRWRQRLLGPINAYTRFQDRRPWAAQLYASIPIYVTGDLLAQYIDGQEFDALRVLRQLAIGLGAAVPGFSW